MKREIGRKGRILTDQELKGAMGGTDNPPPASTDNGSDQQTDANRKKEGHLMTSGRGRPILFFLVPFVLVALATLLPGTIGAQDNCCGCPNDFNQVCVACCDSDQRPVCTPYRDGSCGCTCVLTWSHGGGGCGVKSLSSRTLVIGSDRVSDLADHQLRFGLLHPGDRREGSFNFEEWALVSAAGDKATVLSASTAEFRNRVQDVAERFRPRGKGTSTVLVIEDAEHPHNSREIPVPKVAPIDVDAGLPMSAAGQEAWFRAEVGEDGVVDQVVLLDLPEAFASGSINDRLREHLSLRYTDKGRHRVVVFGTVRADARGHLVMTRSRVILPKCCCGGHFCV
ncbi:MAG TPA: hypothetical protein VF173_21880 [Thermoanaerobaculia bacterium]|nr:hypothetical protein [Thermoanaerobaculia bacterium]